jgi:peptide/nickel transport system ATP-binding protein
MVDQSASAPLLRVEGLTAGFDVAGGFAPAVIDVSLEVLPGETLGLVGESGSGKSVTALSILRLLQPPGRIASGRIRFRGADLLAMNEREIRRVRGAGIGLVFQEPMSALNPVFTAGDQVAEALVVHGLADWPEARRRAVDLLAAVRVPDPELRARFYPHQLSGGMRQRVMIAIAIACRPALVIADEPTTALDVTIQAEILDLLRELRDRYQLALLLITHDLGVIAGMADRVAVMYAGRIVEEAPVGRLFRTPQHPYTRGLLAAMPGRAGARPLPGTAPPLGASVTGCAFEPRCPDRVDACRVTGPALREVHTGHHARCHLCEALSVDAAR